jgi:hypothetical protein
MFEFKTQLTNSRSRCVMLEMFQSGEGADFVIEVVEQQTEEEGQQQQDKKVYYGFLLIPKLIL